MSTEETGRGAAYADAIQITGANERDNKTAKTVLYITGWYFFSTSISVYNKWMFGSGLNFQFPIIVTSFHQFCLFILSTGVLYINPELRPKISNKKLSFFKSLSLNYLVYLKQIFPCSIASSGDIGLSNVSMIFVSLSLYTMVKTSSLVFVLMFGLLFKLEKFHWRLVLIVTIMTISVVMMVKRPESPSGNDVDNEYSSLGVLLVVMASMMSGLRWSFTQILLKNNAYTPNSIATIFYLSPTMCAILLTIGLIVEGGHNFILSNIWEIKGIWGTVGLMILPGILAFMMTLCEFKLLSISQVTTLSVAGIFKEVLTIIMSALIFGDRLSMLNIIGLIITFMDILWYNYFRYLQSRTGYVQVNDSDMELNPMTPSKNS